MHIVHFLWVAKWTEENLSFYKKKFNASVRTS